MNIFITALLTFMFIQFSQQLSAQGCVAIRSTGGICSMPGHNDTTAQSSKWTLSVGNRYFKSFRHFVGDVEQKERLEKHTEVINHAYTLDLGLTRQLNERWSLSLYVPYLSNSRSSLYEHGGKKRYSTHSTGLGDVRFSAGYWVINPAHTPKGNIQTALGIKLPTGDFRYQDFFHTSDSTTVLGPVDQSIQLGDGGTGFTVEVTAFYNFSRSFNVYGNFYYLVNPREQNGVSTSRGGATAATAVAYGTSVMSVPDQMMARAGINYSVKRFSASLGVREECLPVNDLVGGSSGFRRPGYVFSVEPAVGYQFKKAGIYASVPIAVKRNRTQSVADKLRTKKTGVYTQGDAAFADYLVSVGATFKL